MSATRFDTRKRLVAQEANAIGTAYLRARLLPESAQAESAKLFRSYVDARIRCHLALEVAELDALDSQVRDLQTQLWSEAVKAAGADPHSIPIGLFMRALNEVFDVATTRDAARDNHVPETVLFFLFLMATLTMGLLGFGCGLGNCRHLLTTTSVCLLISLVILIIVRSEERRVGKE